MSLIKSGNEIAHKIDVYVSDTGKLPNSLNDVGISETEEGPIFYKKYSDQFYSLVFSDGPDMLIIYNSKNKEWNVEYH